MYTPRLTLVSSWSFFVFCRETAITFAFWKFINFLFCLMFFKELNQVIISSGENYGDSCWSPWGIWALQKPVLRRPSWRSQLFSLRISTREKTAKQILKISFICAKLKKKKKNIWTLYVHFNFEPIQHNCHQLASNCLFFSMTKIFCLLILVEIYCSVFSHSLSHTYGLFFSVWRR